MFKHNRPWTPSTAKHLSTAKHNQCSTLSMQELIDMLNIPLGVILPIIAIELILLIMALVDCIRAEQTNGPKWLWILVIVLIEILGPVFYFVFGRKNR
jgi:hypothetical protein